MFYLLLTIIIVDIHIKNQLLLYSFFTFFYKLKLVTVKFLHPYFMQYTLTDTIWYSLRFVNRGTVYYLT